MSQQQPTLPSQPPSGLVIGLLRLVSYALVIIIEGVFFTSVADIISIFFYGRKTMLGIFRVQCYTNRQRWSRIYVGIR